MNDYEMNDFDKQVMERRIRQSNRKWLARQIVKFGFFVAALIIIIAYFF